MKNIKSLLLLAPLLNIAASENIGEAVTMTRDYSPSIVPEPDVQDHCDLFCEAVVGSGTSDAQINFADIGREHDQCECSVKMHYSCEKQVDAGYSLENRGKGKKIFGNTWACDVKTKSESLKKPHKKTHKPIMKPHPRPDMGCDPMLCRTIFKKEPLVPGYDSDYKVGDKCICFDGNSKYSGTDRYACQKQVDPIGNVGLLPGGIVFDDWACAPLPMNFQIFLNPTLGSRRPR